MLGEDQPEGPLPRQRDQGQVPGPRQAGPAAGRLDKKLDELTGQRRSKRKERRASERAPCCPLDLWDQWDLQRLSFLVVDPRGCVAARPTDPRPRARCLEPSDKLL